MSLKRFKPSEVFTNTMKAHPRCDFVMLEGRTIYNNVPGQQGALHTDVRNVSSSKGYISLYEYNIDRPRIVSDRIVGQSGSYTAAVAAAQAADDPVTFVRDNNLFIHGSLKIALEALLRLSALPHITMNLCTVMY